MEDRFYYYLDNTCGILLFCDKTTCAVGINSLGQKITLGGWDSKLIDDGSEYYIGLSAVKAIIAEYEMLGGKTMLTERIRELLKLEDISELKYILYNKKLTDRRLIRISKEVLNCTQKGDRISHNILKSAAGKLFEMTDVIVRRLSMYDRKYQLCLTGGITEFGEYITEPLCDRIYSRYDNIEIFTYNKSKNISFY